MGIGCGGYGLHAIHIIKGLQSTIECMRQRASAKVENYNKHSFYGASTSSEVGPKSTVVKGSTAQRSVAQCCGVAAAICKG